MREHITGACSYCSGAYEVEGKLKEKGIPLLSEFKGHPSFKRLIAEGFVVLNF